MEDYPEVYNAPALPLGRDFTGIVYLHGSIEQPPPSLVVTDRDFGRAYLTDAWAARFLQDMFRNFTVLFIGYSHNDVVMSYLARGLLPDSLPRFGFASDDPPAEWPGLGIKPICYPSADEHAALGEAMGKWADFSRMGLLDHERRIADLVSKPPPEDPPTLSYLERVVVDDATTALFARHAKGSTWLEWALSLPPFRQLFLPTGELSGAAELTPHQILTPRFAAVDERAVDSSVRALTGNDYDLRQAWEQIFRPHLDDLAALVVAVADRHLRTAHLILRSSGRASDRWDPNSFERSGIEPHPQDSPPQPFDLLIDIARDCLAALLDHAPDQAAGIITSWAASNVPLLRRLAIYGYTHRTDVTADDKLRWAISNKLLYDATVKHELFLLIGQELPNAYAVRNELLEEIKNGPGDGQPEDGSEELRAYAVYDLLNWVTDKAPNFTEAQAALTDLTAEHANFAPREHPDLDLTIRSGFTGPHSPVTVNQILQKTTPQDVDWMLAYQGELQPDTWMDRLGLLSTIGEAAATSPGWALKIAEQLNDKQNWDNDLWPVLVDGWQHSAATLEAGQAADIISQLNQHQSPFGMILSITRLLDALVKRQDFPLAVVDQMEGFALELWNIGTAADSADLEAAADNLGTIAGAAVNHWAGQLANFWAQDTSNRWQNYQDSWDGLPSTTKGALSSMLSGQGFPSLAAAAVIGANFVFLLAADEPWTTENVIPAFNWDADTDRAASAWAGHLVIGQWDNRASTLLRTFFEQSFSRIAAELRTPLAIRVADMSLYGAANPLDSDLIPKYVSSADEKDRRKFASTVYDFLRKEQTGFAETQWDRWIRRYWRNRLESIPLPLTATEAGEMVNWVFTAGKYVPEAVELATQRDAEIPSSFLFFRRLKESSVVEDTESAARLVAHVLSGATDAALACEEIGQVIYLLADHRVARTRRDLVDACSHAARLGCTDALTWESYVQSQLT